MRQPRIYKKMYIFINTKN